MGDTDTNGIGKADPGPTGQPGGDTKSGSSTATGTGTGTGGIGGVGGTGGDKAEKELAPVPVRVNAPAQNQAPRKAGETDEEYKKRLEKNERKRIAYAEAKAQSGGAVKPRKVNGTKPNTTAQPIDTNQITMLLKSANEIVASRPGMEIWKLSETEIKSITTPLGNILAKSEKLAMIGEHSDAIALVIACITIFGPRAMITITMKKGEKKNAKPVTTDGTIRKLEPVEKGKDQAVTGNSNRQPTSNGSGNGKSLPWFGDPTA